MQPLPFGLSVVICCHNSAARLPATLARLTAQRASQKVSWEVIIVDNASTDDTGAVAQECWKKNTAAPLRIVGEPHPGLAFARERGVATARYEFISFVDDDNWVADDWVELAATFLRDHPDVGAIGGSSTAAFEKEPATWFRDCQILYAVSPENWGAGERTAAQPLWGAGLTIRKAAWQDVDPASTPFLATGRLGRSLAGGEDSELCYRLLLAGWKVWYEPRLRFEHYMPEGRLTWDYTRRLHRGSGAASATLAPYAAVLSPPGGPFAACRQSWEWQLQHTVRRLIRRPWKLVQAATAHCEGDLDVLQVEELYGRLMGFLPNRSCYYRSLAQVKEMTKRLQSRSAITREHCVQVV